MYRLLHIEADAAARQAVLAALGDSPLPFAIEHASDIALTPPAGEAPVDAILLGAGGLADPLAAIGRCWQANPDRPIILLTDTADLAFARAALRAGAQDVVQQHERALAVLSRILLYAIERAGAERRHRRLEAEAAGLKALLDAVVAGPCDGIVQTDGHGGIERLSPGAAALLGTDWPPPPGASLAERVFPTERPRLTTFLKAAEAPDARPAVFTFGTAGASRQLELAPIALAGTPDPAPRLFRVTAFEASFGVDEADLTATSGKASQHRTVSAGHGPSLTTLSPPAASATTAMTAAQAAAGSQSRGSGPSADGPFAQLQALASTARWQSELAGGNGAPLGVLTADPATAAALDGLAAAARENADLALACDTLRLDAWRDLTAACTHDIAERLLLEVSYATAASRPHLERLSAAIEATAAGLAGRFQLVLHGVPRGIHVPTLGKTIRTMGAAHGRPGVQLPDLDADYRALVLGQLGLVVLTLGDLKRALTHDAKAVAAFLARSRSEGCRSLVRGVTGSLAEALRTRLGIDMTVAA